MRSQLLSSPDVAVLSAFSAGPLLWQGADMPWILKCGTVNCPVILLLFEFLWSCCVLRLVELLIIGNGESSRLN